MKDERRSIEDDPGRAAARSTRRTTTIKDVALLSGVSAATVTRALQGHPRVRPTTRGRVEDAAERLGYRPNHIARTLVTGSSKTIGLLIPTTSDRYWAEVVVGIEQRAAESGFSVLLGSSQGDRERSDRMLELFLGKRVDAIVATAAAGVDDRWLEEGPGPPVVVVGWDPPVEPHDLDVARSLPAAPALAAAQRRSGYDGLHVSFDDVDGAGAAIRHLVEVGHREIAILAGPPVLSSVLRVLGARLALGRAGLQPVAVVPCDDTLEGGRAAAKEVLTTVRPTALLAYNDLVAIGALRAAHALGIGVPGETSIVGVDDIDVAAFVEPPLTTVRQPKQEMGARAVDLLLERLADGSRVLRSEFLRGDVLVRSSTGRPPA
jgi:LacI family transcriptional regulator